MLSSQASLSPAIAISPNSINLFSQGAGRLVFPQWKDVNAAHHRSQCIRGNRMIGKCCVAAALLFAGTAAAQTSTTLNGPIVITHGAPLTTFTFVNNSGNTLPAGSPVSFGQAFRYGDIM